MTIKVGDRLLISHAPFGIGEAVVTKLTVDSTRGRLVYFTLDGHNYYLNGAEFKDALEAANPTMFEREVDSITL